MGAGGPDPSPLENHTKYFFSNLGSDPLEINKATKPAFHDGQSSSPQRRRFTGGSMMAQNLVVFGSTHQQKKKTMSKLAPLWKN